MCIPMAVKKTLNRFSEIRIRYLVRFARKPRGPDTRTAPHKLTRTKPLFTAGFSFLGITLSELMVTLGGEGDYRLTRTAMKSNKMTITNNTPAILIFAFTLASR